MTINRLREQRRRDIANKEKEDMIRRYPLECSQPIIRKATPEELNIVGRKTNEKEHAMFLRNTIDTY